MCASDESRASLCKSSVQDFGAREPGVQIPVPYHRWGVDNKANICRYIG